MNKKAIFIAAVLLITASAAFFSFSNSKKQQPESDTLVIAPELYKNGEDIFITPAQLKEKLGNKDLVILDGSHPKGYAKGHIPGAISIGFKGLCRSEGKPGVPLWGTILPKDRLTEKLQSLGITNDSLIVAYSDTFKGPGAGGRAVWQLRMAGLKNVKLLYGGLPTWKLLDYELTTEVQKPTPSTGLVLADYATENNAPMNYVKENLSKTVFIDVRTKKEFTGQDTSRGEARGGHLPGAKWLEWTVFLNKDGTPKPPEDIKALMANVGVKPEDDFVLY